MFYSTKLIFKVSDLKPYICSPMSKENIWSSQRINSGDNSQLSPVAQVSSPVAVETFLLSN